MNTSSADMMKALLLVLTDQKHRSDAVFVHGSSVNSVDLDERVLNHLNEIQVRNLIVNGTSDDRCREKKLAYPGCETWLRQLETIGFNRDDVQFTPEALHTAAESDAVINICQSKGYRSLTLLALPHHILRCMLQMIFCLQRKKVELAVYAQTFGNVDWNMDAMKTVLGGSTIQGVFSDHIDAEHQRIEKYMDRSGTGYTPHATLTELIQYMSTRRISDIVSPA